MLIPVLSAANRIKVLGDVAKTLIATYTQASVGETLCKYACSDHAVWHMQNFPAAFPFESSFENSNKRLHTGEDKIEFLDVAHAHYFTQLGLAFAGEMAEVQ